MKTYPPRIQEFARRLYADGEGRSINEIREALKRRGYTPKRETILYWVDEEFKAAHLHRQRKYRPPGPARRKGWQLRLERMEELKRDAALSASATARVMKLDFGVDLSRHQVETILAGRCQPKTARRVLYPKAEA